MKMLEEHYQYLKSALAPFSPNISKHRKFIIEEGKSKDIEMRLRWDLMWTAVKSQWVCDNLYTYLNDSHIDTALKNIVKEIENNT